MSNITVALDAGHGGSDPGARYNDRLEKDDVLNLTKAVGNILEKNGINVFYVRNDDEYETPFKKASDANNADADYYVSLHRNSSVYKNQYSGIESLVYQDSGTAAELARNINQQLESLGFTNIGVSERPNLVVLRRTKMPAVLVEVGFINTDPDNEIFDNDFDEVANAIATGIMQTIFSGANKTSVDDSAETDDYLNRNYFEEDNRQNNENSDMYNENDSAYGEKENEWHRQPDFDNYQDDSMQRYPFIPGKPAAPNGSQPARPMPREFRPAAPSPEQPSTDGRLYRVQVGAYSNKENADRLLDALLIEGFPAFIVYEDGYYKVQVGAFAYLSNAIKMERRLRRFRYNTYIVFN